MIQEDLHCLESYDSHRDLQHFIQKLDILNLHHLSHVTERTDSIKEVWSKIANGVCMSNSARRVLA